MSIFSDSFRVVAWFALCIVMAVAMFAFAIIYGVASYLLRKIAWKQISFGLPSIRLAK